jgi:hypothetical protein
VLRHVCRYIEYTYDPTGGDGSFLNKVLLAPLLQGTLTLLSFKVRPSPFALPQCAHLRIPHPPHCYQWTYDMLAKMGKKAGASDKGKKD